MANSRRTFLTGAAGLAALGAMGTGLLGAAGNARAAMGKGPDALNLRTDGTYDTVELAKPAWTIGLMQTPVHTFEVSALKAGMQRNLKYLADAIDKAATTQARTCCSSTSSRSPAGASGPAPKRRR